MSQITEFITLSTIQCSECDCLFALTDSYKKRFQQTGKTFYCPNGHGQCYNESENARLKKELEEKQRELTAQKCETLRRQQLLANQLAETKKIERRIKHGTCPCCKRTFVRLANHIAKKHPDFGPQVKRKLP